jgi:hypothetical protein
VRNRITVPASQWRRGLVACERLGDWLKVYEERARATREGREPEPRPAKRRRRPRPSSS